MNRKKSLPWLIYIIYLSQPLQCFLSLRAHILDTDDLGTKLALIERKLHQTNSKLGQRLDTVEGSSYKHFFIMWSNGFN